MQAASAAGRQPVANDDPLRLGITDVRGNSDDSALPAPDTEAAPTASMLAKATPTPVPEQRERKFKGPTGALVLAPVLGVSAAAGIQLFDKAIYGALVVAVLIFVLAVIDDFVDQKDVHTELMDRILMPWLKTSIASYAAAAAIGIFAVKAGASAGEATAWAAGLIVLISLVLFAVLVAVESRSKTAKAGVQQAPQRSTA